MNMALIQQEEIDARMAMVRGHRNKFLTDADRAVLVQQHAYARTKVRVARALAQGPKLTSNQKREIAAML